METNQERSKVNLELRTALAQLTGMVLGTIRTNDITSSVRDALVSKMNEVLTLSNMTNILITKEELKLLEKDMEQTGESL